MKRASVLFAATTALTAAVGLSAWSAARAPSFAGHGIVADLFRDGAERLSFRVVSDDDDRGRRRHARHHRGDDDDDDDHGSRGRIDPAAAGNATPPANGLFGDGAGPRVRSN